MNSSKKTKKYKFNGKRFLKSLTLSVVMLLLIVTIMSTTGQLFSSAYKVQRYDEYGVREGDTLWSIAQSYDEDYDDIRYFIYQIKKANDLQSDYIVPGQALKIPRGE